MSHPFVFRLAFKNGGLLGLGARIRGTDLLIEGRYPSQLQKLFAPADTLALLTLA